MKTKIVLLLLALVTACEKKTEPVEEFPSALCKYEPTDQTSSYTIQAGCAMYGTDSKGGSTGVCLAPIYSEQKQRAVNITCSKKVWRDF